MGISMTEYCNSLETLSGEPCHQEVSYGTKYCAASHPVSQSRWSKVYSEVAIGGNMVYETSTMDIEEIMLDNKMFGNNDKESFQSFPPSPSIEDFTSKNHSAFENLPFEEWRRADGTLHRDPQDGPAITFYDGSQHYYVDGKLHRMDGPAVIDVTNQVEKWYRHGDIVVRNGSSYVDDSHSVPLTIHHADGSTTTNLGPGKWQSRANDIYSNGNALANSNQRQFPAKYATFAYVVPPELAKDGVISTIRDTVLPNKDGFMEYVQVGPLHNRWGPAKITADGGKYCYIVNRRHCINGHAAMSEADGSTRHFVFGQEVSGPSAGCSCS